MRCIIVDDEYKSIELLKSYAAEVSFLQVVDTFRNPVAALEFIQQNKIDLVFLDINMPRLTGIEVVRSLKTRPLIIFTTAYAQHAVEGFELEVVDYLLKPIMFDRFLRAVNKAQAILQTPEPQVEKTGDFVLIKSGPQVHQVRRSQISHVEKDANYSTFYTDVGNIVTRLSFGQVEALVGSGFLRVHRSFIVALDRIHVIESNQIILNKIKIPVGSTYKTALLQAMEARGKT